jgi:hypothetical protein
LAQNTKSTQGRGNPDLEQKRVHELAALEKKNYKKSFKKKTVCIPFPESLNSNRLTSSYQLWDQLLRQGPEPPSNHPRVLPYHTTLPPLNIGTNISLCMGLKLEKNLKSSN